MSDDDDYENDAYEKAEDEDDGAGSVDEVPSKETKSIIKDTNTINYPLDERKKATSSQSRSTGGKVRFNTTGDAVKKQPVGQKTGQHQMGASAKDSRAGTASEKATKVEPSKLEKLKQQQALEQKMKYLTFEDIISDSKSNKHVIYKFMKKGFTALSAEELACTMVNPTFSIDFKANVGEDWNIQY
jgi:hypothetical protein